MARCETEANWIPPNPPTTSSWIQFPLRLPLLWCFASSCGGEVSQRVGSCFHRPTRMFSHAFAQILSYVWGAQGRYSLSHGTEADRVLRYRQRLTVLPRDSLASGIFEFLLKCDFFGFWASWNKCDSLQLADGLHRRLSWLLRLLLNSRRWRCWRIGRKFHGNKTILQFAIDTPVLQSVTPVDIYNSDMNIRCLEPRDRC